MSEQFYTILTKLGKAKIANASALGTTLNLIKFKVGDSNGSYYNPMEDQQTLKNKVWEGPVSSITIDENNPNWIIIQAMIPGDIGGFMIREAGVFDSEDNLIAIGKYPETYKPLASEGSSKDLFIKMILEVSNTASVTLKIDPTVILATKKDIQILEQKIENIKVPVESVNSKTGAIELKAEDINCNDGKSIESHLGENKKQLDAK
ncbi:phage tail protein, partial [Clostridium ihumii]|uniref:phage tail protein n=1 Tax=Clostridium ihumii TaxID=1470356 RepID=UPI0013922276